MSGHEGSFRDRLASLSRMEIAGLVLVVLVTLAGAGVWYVRSLPRPVTVAAGDIGTEAPVPGPGASPAVGEGSIFVHVVGRVRRPGVFEFEPGARVVDAVQAAGGPRWNAALEALNLAAPLTDGQQILVPSRAQAAAAATPGAPGAVAGDASGGPINVNTASAAELEALPGIGPVLSQSIVDFRTEHGPFTSVDQLQEVSGIGPATLEKIRPHVTI